MSRCLSQTALVAIIALWIPGNGAALQIANPLPVETLETDIPFQSWGRLGGVAVDRLGFIYLSNFGEDVWRITPDGAVTTLAENLYGASGNAVGPDGALYQAEFYRNRIHRISRSGEHTIFAESPDLNQPVGIVFDAEDNLVVARCDGSMARVSPDGKATTWVRSRLLGCTNGVALGPDGAIYVVTFGTDDVLRVSPEGDITLIATLTESETNPGNAHIAYLDGWFYVTKLKTHSLWRVALDGGRAERVPVVNPDQIRYPNGLAAFGRTLWFNVLEGRRNPPSDARLYLRSVQVPRGY